MSLTTASKMAEDVSTEDGFLQKIEAAMAPWMSSDKEPPYTMEHIVVMAMLCADRPLASEEIFSWLIDSFRFYRHVVTQEHIANHRHVFVRHARPGGPAFESQRLHQSFREALRCFETPLEIHGNEDQELSWTIRASDGNAVLAGILAEPQANTQKPFNFFGLPGELRAKIYDMVFGYPRSGLHIRRFGYTQKGTIVLESRFGISDRSYHESFDLKKWERKVILKESLSTWPMGRVLAPLSTSKRFYNEAMPTFYRINHFHLENPALLHSFLCSLAPGRSKHIGHISVACEHFGHYMTPKASELLAQIEHLRKLQFHFDEQRWLDMAEGNNGKVIKKYTTVKNMPGYGALRAIRGLDEVTFVGCPTLEKLLKADMEKPKSMKKDSADAGKRKGRGAELEQEKGARKKKVKAT